MPSFVGSQSGNMAQPAAASQFVSMTGTVTCIVTVTVAGTLVLNYYATGAASARSASVNHSFGQSTGITAVRIPVAV